MSLKDDLGTDLAIFFDTDDFGDTGEYTSREAGLTVDVRVIIDYGQVQGQDVANTISSHAIANIPRVDLPSPPKNGDILVVDSVEWTIIRQSGGDKHVVSVEMRRAARNQYK